MADYSLAATDVALHGVTLEEGVADTVTVATTADYVLMVHPGATEPVYVGFSPIAVGDADAHAVFGGFGLELASVPGGTAIHIVSDDAATYTLARTSAQAVRYAIAAAGGGGIIGTITPEDIGAAPEEHTHEQADITGLTAALNGKASTSHNHDADYAALAHDHDEDYAAAGHNHDADYAAIDHDHDEDYAAAGHTHTAGEVSGLAAVATSGAYSDLSGTPSIPDSPDDIGAAAAGHNHDADYA